jgi:RNA polymerase sigma-70 factor, ECF subfamily
MILWVSLRNGLSVGGTIEVLVAAQGALPVREKPAPDATDDASLVCAARDGDRAAFGRLYDRYARMVHGVLLAKVPVDEVDDLVQDVFLIALRRLSTLRGNDSFGAWLTTIARNRANDYHRRSRPQQQLEDETSDQEVEAVSPVGDQEYSPLAILKTILSLSEAYRETLILRLVEGMTGPEIAARTGMTHGSVRVNLHRGMQQLRTMLRSNAVSLTSQQEAQG